MSVIDKALVPGPRRVMVSQVRAVGQYRLQVQQYGDPSGSILGPQLRGQTAFRHFDNRTVGVLNDIEVHLRVVKVRQREAPIQFPRENLAVQRLAVGEPQMYFPARLYRRFNPKALSPRVRADPFKNIVCR